MKVRRTTELFLLFALGSQFDHLIKQALEKLGVFCLVASPGTITAKEVRQLNPKGIILSGGPGSVNEVPPPFDCKIFDLGIPTLGICLGLQLWAKHIGVRVDGSGNREFGVHNLTIYDSNLPLLDKSWNGMAVLQSHGDKVMPDDRLTILGRTENAPVAAANYQHLWGVQFHPEVTHTQNGLQIYENFCFKICQAKDRFPAQDIAQQKVAWLRDKIGDQNVLLGLSGGSDSSTVAYLLKTALSGGKAKLYGLYIKGIDRPDDLDNVEKFFGNQLWIELIIVDAADRFLETLKGKTSMPEKRLAMRSVYKAVFEEWAKKLGVKFIAQGTLYTDISESGNGYASDAKKARIKLHHNVGLGFSFEEVLPLADCVKDGGRNIGRLIGVPEELLTRHPFPGPGMVVRIEGEVTPEKLAIARQADQIFISELRKWKLYETVWQAGAVVTASQTTCTKGDEDFQGVVVALWAVWSVNGFTAKRAHLPEDFLDRLDQRICNEIPAVGATVLRITGKPPATIEWG